MPSSWYPPVRAVPWSVSVRTRSLSVGTRSLSEVCTRSLQGQRKVRTRPAQGPSVSAPGAHKIPHCQRKAPKGGPQRLHEAPKYIKPKVPQMDAGAAQRDAARGRREKPKRRREGIKGAQGASRANTDPKRSPRGGPKQPQWAPKAAQRYPQESPKGAKRRQR